jgi:predicted RecB family nuclease
VVNSEDARQIARIEEDLERTRKLASSGITTREELVRTLLPILPLQFQPSLQPEDVTERLRRRIRAIAPNAAQIALNEDVPVTEVVRLLGEKA